LFAVHTAPSSGANTLWVVTMPESQPRLLTVGEIARRIGSPIHRVEYVIGTRNIRPGWLAGNSRVFTDVDLRFIAAEILRIDAEREAVTA